LGARVSGATVALWRDGAPVTDTRTDAQGRFAFSNVPEGRYALEARAEGFAPRVGEPFFLAAAGHITSTLTLQVGLEQNVLVTASAVETPASQTGASATVIDRATIDTLAKADVLESLRLVPGVSVVQRGARGGGTSLFVRGGESDFNKILIDGVPANDIGGAFDFSNVATTGIERVELLRDANSVLYGTDALAGVVSLTTRRGRTRIPELSVSFDGGNLGTHREEASIGGTARRVDYFLDVSQFRTDNALANNAFDNKTLASRFGVQLGNRSDLTLTIRHANSEAGAPNAFNLFGVADDAVSKADATYVGASFESQISTRWRVRAQFASMDQSSHYNNPTPTGEAFDPFGFGANYLGKNVTIRGANGYSVTGQGILDFGGVFPATSDSNATRRAGYGHVTGRLADWLDLSAGARVEREAGVSRFSAFDAFSPAITQATERMNGGVFAEARVTLRRVFASAGLGYDHHAVFKSAVTPRMSLAVYLRDPSAAGRFGETKLTVNAGKGIKAPNISEELSSLFTVVQALPAATRPSVAGLSPIGPERNRSFDVGVEQGLFGGKARARAAFFHNQFSDLIEYVSANVLPRLGIPPAVASATGFGAYVNSSSYRARGVELSADVHAGPSVRVMASFTHVDAVVSESFGSTALAPATNPAFPSIPIGAYGPLKGASPFRRPANSGSVLAAFTKGPLQIALAGYFAGKSDDSTFLSDAFFGNSLLLPNHHLNAGYQKIDLSGSYQLHPRLRWYSSVENLLDQDYQQAFGFPALPGTIRTGLSVTIGGDRARRP
jgi:iron complex outermembrane receptor protein/vitamin B12 transporter